MAERPRDYTSLLLEGFQNHFAQIAQMRMEFTQRFDDAARRFDHFQQETEKTLSSLKITLHLVDSLKEDIDGLTKGEQSLFPRLAIMKQDITQLQQLCQEDLRQIEVRLLKQIDGVREKAETLSSSETAGKWELRKVLTQAVVPTVVYIIATLVMMALLALFSQPQPQTVEFRKIPPWMIVPPK